MSNLRPQRGFKVVNDSGMIIPPYSIVVVTRVEYLEEDIENGIDADTIHHVDQYSGQSGNIMVTGPTQINVDYGGYAYADQLLYVAVDPDISSGSSGGGSTSGGVLSPGDVLGPISGKWWIGRDGAGFSAQGEPVRTVEPATNGDYADSAAIFYRYGGGESKNSTHWCKVITPVVAGTITTPTVFYVDVYIKDPDEANTLQPFNYIRSEDPDLLNLKVTNRLGFSSPTGFSTSGSTSEPDALIEKIDGEWHLTHYTQQVVKNVECDGDGLIVTRGNIG